MTDHATQPINLRDAIAALRDFYGVETLASMGASGGEISLWDDVDRALLRDADAAGVREAYAIFEAFWELVDTAGEPLADSLPGDLIERVNRWFAANPPPPVIR